MCGKCESCMVKAAHGAIILGALSMLLAAVSKLAHWGACGVGPRSFTAAAGLLLLFSIAVHSCPGVRHKEEEPHTS